jgi:hypothetical protein
MNDDIDFLKREIISLHAETLALQTLLFELMISIRASGAIDSHFLERSFDHAADSCEAIAIRAGKTADPGHTVGALRIVEQLRNQFMAAE